MIDVNQDPLGYGGRRIGYSECHNVSYMLLTKQFVSNPSDNKAHVLVCNYFISECLPDLVQGFERWIKSNWSL